MASARVTGDEVLDLGGEVAPRPDEWVGHGEGPVRGKRAFNLPTFAWGPWWKHVMSVARWTLHM